MITRSARCSSSSKSAVGIMRRWRPGINPLSRFPLLPEGMITVDSSEFPKKGKESVGSRANTVAPLARWITANPGFLSGIPAPKAMVFSPVSCICLKNGFPWPMPNVERTPWFRRILSSRPNLRWPWLLIKEIVEKNLFAARWIGCDATFGSDPAFLDPQKSVKMVSEPDFCVDFIMIWPHNWAMTQSVHLVRFCVMESNTGKFDASKCQKA